MATIAQTLPRLRRPRFQPAGGRASIPEIYFVKHIDNSRLHRERDPQKARECFGLLGAGLLLFLFGLLFAWHHFQGVRYGYQIQQLKAQRGALEEWNHHLRLEHASLSDPQRIDTIARKVLGLAPPSARQVVIVHPEDETQSPSGTEELARNSPAAWGGSSNQP